MQRGPRDGCLRCIELQSAPQTARSRQRSFPPPRIVRKLQSHGRQLMHLHFRAAGCAGSRLDSEISEAALAKATSWEKLRTVPAEECAWPKARPELTR